MPLERPLWIAQVAHPRTDPAFDRGADKTPARDAWMTAARRYVQTRAPKDLAALPRKENRKPRLYAIGVLTPEAYAMVMAQQTPETRIHLAVLCGVQAWQDDAGLTHEPTLEATGAGVSRATAAWLRTLHDLGGGQLLTELAAVVLRRYEIGDQWEDADPLDLHNLGGLHLGR